MALAMKATVTTMSSNPCWRSRLTTCSIIGMLAMGNIGLGWLEVRGRSRVPSPPAMITAFMGPSHQQGHDPQLDGWREPTIQLGIMSLLMGWPHEGGDHGWRRGDPTPAPYLQPAQTYVAHGQHPDDGARGQSAAPAWVRGHRGHGGLHGQCHPYLFRGW